MRKVCAILSVTCLLMLLVSVLSSVSQAQAVLQDRITQPISNAATTRMVGSVHPMAKAEYDQGLADNSKMIQDMTINFKRTDAQQASLAALLRAQQDPSSTSYHQWLTQAQFGELFGMSASDLAQVTAWLQQEGFTITGTSASNNAIIFSGTVASVERAFQTEIHNYSMNGETHFANSTQISLPAAFAGTVIGVHGLNDFRVKPRLQLPKTRLSGQNPHFTSGISGNHYLTPGDIAVIYDLNPLYQAGDTGKGITLAVVGQTDIVPADITDFRSAAGLSVNNPTVVTVPGSTPLSPTAGAASGDLDETDLDLEYSGGVATGASIVLVNSNDVALSLQYAIESQINGITIPIISMSYGGCEASWSTSDINAIESQLQQANTQGQTVILAAGDTGAADCDDSQNPPETSAVNGLAVDYPGSSAYVTDLGGSEFMGDGTAQNPQTGSGQYWNGASGSNDLVTSVKSYIPEMAWNDTTFAISQGGGLSAGGGGVSALFSKPSWQTGVAGIPADGHRDVPDVSLDASPDHDGYLYCTQVQTIGSGNNYVSSCQNGFRIVDTGQSDNNDLTSAGGTSFAAPQFAGLLAIIEQKLNAGGGQGNLNPALYSLAANSTTYASAFHDITTGNNQVPCTTGSPDCPSGSNPVIGYTAGTGYDLATGLGSLDGNNLATAYAALIAATGTTTALTANPGTSLNINESVTFTATVTPNTASTTPTGTVTFIVDGTAQTPVNISSASPYTAAFKTDFPTAGAHTVSATYSGDSTYRGSTATALPITVTATGTSSTTTAVTANPTSFALGSSVTLVATVTATGTAGTLTGPVTFTTGGQTIGKVSQVTLGSGNTATATLNVASATASLGFTPGTDTITATYGGDSFNTGSSGTTNVTVSNPGITVTATNMTISSPSPGNSGTSTITLTSTGGYAGTAVVSASGSFDATYGFGSSGAQTANVALSSGGTGTTTITITTVAASGSFQKGIGGNLRKSAARIAAAGGTAAGCILLLLVPGIRRKRWPVALGMLIFLSVGAGLGCGGGTGGGTPAGTYTVTITAADSSNSNITGTGTFTLTIQ
ncbi:MAG TPA: protease pro-enzyme activation domain-containing protein [Acidobacteriaceae bacterium]|nr:protease pro-enzyme activation domain-containing protein [Acidobacteriaceae bacterium]